MKEHIYKVPKGGIDHLSVFDQLSVHQTQNFTSRRDRRGAESEFKKNILKLSVVEMEYCEGALDESIDQILWYNTALQLWNDLIDWMIKNKQFKYTVPNMYYFQKKYKPVNVSTPATELIKTWVKRILTKN